MTIRLTITDTTSVDPEELQRWRANSTARYQGVAPDIMAARLAVALWSQEQERLRDAGSHRAD